MTDSVTVFVPRDPVTGTLYPNACGSNVREAALNAEQVEWDYDVARRLEYVEATLTIKNDVNITCDGGNDA